MRSSSGAFSSAVVGVATREPNSGMFADTPQANRGSMETKCTASVSPGSAPSTWNGPVCGLRYAGSHTWETTSEAERTRPPKQSNVHVDNAEPGAMDATASTPPNV